MNTQNNIKLGAIILAAGKGSRMKSKDANKVTLPLANKPIILHSIHRLEELNFESIVVVVGFAKDSVKNVLKDSRVGFAEQTKRLGTAHAALRAMGKLDSSITDVLIVGGDDSHFYTREIIEKLTNLHLTSGASLTFLTINVENPQGLGRVIRDGDGNVIAIMEEKDASDEQRKIREINPACYVFKTSFLRQYLPRVQKSPVTGEYYLTSLIDIAIKYNEKIETLRAGFMSWRGVNTKEELLEAEQMFKSLKVE